MLDSTRDLGVAKKLAEPLTALFVIGIGPYFKMYDIVQLLDPKPVRGADPSL